MKNIFLPIVVPVLLVTLGFGQNPAPPSSTDQASIKGCLTGTEGNYVVAEDGTTQTFRITSSTVDLKPHVGHDVEITGQKANVSANASPSDNSIIVTGMNMISDHCTAATASAPAVADPAPAATASAPAVTDTTTTTTTSTATTTAPAAPDTTIATASTPATVDATPPPPPAPAAIAATPAETASAPMAAKASAADQTEQLPETASSLPLVGLMGLGLLGMGLLIGRLRRN